MTGIAPTLYLQKHNLVACYNEIFTKLIQEQPENPLLWTAKQFQTMYRMKHKKLPYLSSSVEIESNSKSRPWTANSLKSRKSVEISGRRPMTANSASFQVFNAQRLMKDTIFKNSQKPEGPEIMKIVGKVNVVEDSGIDDEFIPVKNYDEKPKDYNPGIFKPKTQDKVPTYVKLSCAEPYKKQNYEKTIPVAETVDLEDEILGAQVSIKTRIPTFPAKKFDRAAKFSKFKVRKNNVESISTQTVENVVVVEDPEDLELPESVIHSTVSRTASQIGLPETARDLDLSGVGFPVMD